MAHIQTGQVGADKGIADARVDAAKARAAAVRELADRLTAELVQARRPWGRRLIGDFTQST